MKPAPRRMLQPDRNKLAHEKGFGGADRDRTGGLVVANDALSQLSYSPTCKVEDKLLARLSYQRFFACSNPNPQ
jgi:hypothetical protein